MRSFMQNSYICVECVARAQNATVTMDVKSSDQALLSNVANEYREILAGHWDNRPG